MDTRARRVLHGGPAAINVACFGARQPADHAGLAALGDLGNGGEVSFGGNRKARLDDINAHFFEQLGNIELFLMGHRRAGRLLAIAQRRVKDQNAALLGGISIGRRLGVSGSLNIRRGHRALIHSAWICVWISSGTCANP